MITPYYYYDCSLLWWLDPYHYCSLPSMFHTMTAPTMTMTAPYYDDLIPTITAPYHHWSLLWLLLLWLWLRPTTLFPTITAPMIVSYHDCSLLRLLHNMTTLPQVVILNTLQTSCRHCVIIVSSKTWLWHHMMSASLCGERRITSYGSVTMTMTILLP